MQLLKMTKKTSANVVRRFKSRALFGSEGAKSDLGDDYERCRHSLDYRCHGFGALYDTAGVGSVLWGACARAERFERVYAMFRHCLLNECIYGSPLATPSPLALAPPGIGAV